MTSQLSALAGGLSEKKAESYYYNIFNTSWRGIISRYEYLGSTMHVLVHAWLDGFAP